MLNKDLVLRRAAEAAAGIVNQGTAKNFLEETSFFPAHKTQPVPPPAREENPVVNGEKPKAGAGANAAAKKWDAILPQAVGDVWMRKKEPEQKTPAKPADTTTVKNGGTDFKKEPPPLPSVDKKNSVSQFPPVKLQPTPPISGKSKPDLKTPPPTAKPRADIKTLNSAGVPEIIFQRKGGPAPAIPASHPEPSAVSEVAFAAAMEAPAPTQFPPLEEFNIAPAAPAVVIEEFPAPKQEPFEVKSVEPAAATNDLPPSLSRLAADLEKEKEERRRAEQRAASLAGQLQSLHQELGGQLATEQHNQKRIAELEEELRVSKADLEQLRADSEKLKADRALAEKQSKIIAELKERLQKALSLFRESHEAFQKSRTELEGSLGTLSLTDTQKSNPLAPID